MHGLRGRAMDFILCVPMVPQCPGLVEMCFSGTAPEHGQQVAEQVPGHQALGRDEVVWRKLEVNPELNGELKSINSTLF